MFTDEPITIDDGRLIARRLDQASPSLRAKVLEDLDQQAVARIALGLLTQLQDANAVPTTDGSSTMAGVCARVGNLHALSQPGDNTTAEERDAIRSRPRSIVIEATHDHDFPGGFRIKKGIHEHEYDAMPVAVKEHVEHLSTRNVITVSELTLEAYLASKTKAPDACFPPTESDDDHS